MEISPFLLAQLLFFSFLFGVLLGVINDVNRIIRAFCGQKYSNRKFKRLYSFFKIDREEVKDFKSNVATNTAVNILIFFQDVIFMIMSAFGIIMLNYELNDGKFRIFGVVATICGFLLYFFTIGKLVVTIFEPIVVIIKVCFNKVLKIIFTPVKLFLDLILTLERKLFNSIKKELEKRGNMRYNNIRTKNIAELADKGFLT